MQVPTTTVAFIAFLSGVAGYDSLTKPKKFSLRHEGTNQEYIEKERNDNRARTIAKLNQEGAQQKYIKTKRNENSTQQKYIKTKRNDNNIRTLDSNAESLESRDLQAMVSADDCGGCDVGCSTLQLELTIDDYPQENSIYLSRLVTYMNTCGMLIN